jgi:hypothetical protein
MAAFHDPVISGLSWAAGIYRIMETEGSGEGR